MGPINRDHKLISAYTCDVVGNLAKITELDFAGYAGGVILLPSGSPITSITFYASCARANGNQTAQVQSAFQPLYDNTNTTPVAIAFANLTIPSIVGIPDACFGAGSLKLVTNAKGSVDISLKG